MEPWPARALERLGVVVGIVAGSTISAISAFSGTICGLALASVIAMAALPALASDTAHPRLLLTSQDVAYLSAGMDSSPGFMESLRATRTRIDEYFREPPEVPVPADAGGGYTHEQHKRNGIAIHDAGILYQLTRDAAYADYAKALLLDYAALYPGLGEHPQKKEQTPGRLFWQSLNEAVWLVYAIQGYDAVLETLSQAERQDIEQNLLRNMADFLSVESPETFDRLHNHGTWAVAAVGMTGYVLDDKDYVETALRGLAKDGAAGFLKQLDVLFSPDGYYTEGPYYQRYALMPFVLFARSIHANDPELGIFEYRDNILLKAIYSCAELSYADLFFPINDAIKDKGLDTVELRYGIAIAYALTSDPTLLSIASRQSSFVLNGDGFELARAIDQGLSQPFPFQSMLLRDGPEGRQGALAILRQGYQPGHQALVLKATAQGMGHGHFDKLNWLFYDNGEEIVTDYGAARFLNVEQKFGGHYLPENTTWAKQTVAHNTLVVDGRSHFDGQLPMAEQRHPRPLFFESNDHIQVVGAMMRGAYPDVNFSRTMAMLKKNVDGLPLIVDVLNVGGGSSHQYDLPLHYNGQFIAASSPVRSHAEELRPLGEANGYQHLWLRGQAAVEVGEDFSFTWLNKNRFYTYSTLAHSDLEILFAELGANDPDFNLRRQPALILRAAEAQTQVFVSVLEPHGEYNGAEEYTRQSRGSVRDLQRFSADGADVIRIATHGGAEYFLALSYNPQPEVSHRVPAGERVFEWDGYYALFQESEL